MTLRPKRDVAILFSTRILRLFAYGFLSVILALYLSARGLSEGRIGFLLTLTLFGDAGISLWLTTSADRIGRRRMLILGACLMTLAGVVFIFTGNVVLLTLAAVVGVISPSGNEIGPFLSIEQAGLTQLVSNERRTQSLAWYNLAGSFATAAGALAGGWLSQSLQSSGWSELDSYRFVLAGYALTGVVLVFCFLAASPAVEVAPQEQTRKNTLGLHKSRGVVLKLSSMFALDAFAGGLILQSMIAFWFHLRFGVEPGIIGSIFFGANILAGVSALLAVWIARKIGLINTMVFTHIPSNILLIFVPLMPNLPLAITLLLLRFSISQMDVPTRQSYTMAVVAPDERSAASGVTTIARSIGSAISPSLTGIFLGVPALVSMPFLLSGGLKIIYDLALWRTFRAIKPPEEIRSPAEKR
jgi:MFS family permease